MAKRPWQRQHYMLGLDFASKLTREGRQAAIGWAALGMPGPSAEGEDRFQEPLTPEAAATAAILRYREMKARTESDDEIAIEVYRYTAESWPSSTAAAEGGTHEGHEAMIRAVVDALRDEDAKVIVKII